MRANTPGENSTISKRSSLKTPFMNSRRGVQMDQTNAFTDTRRSLN
jgi:hypothetical protein